MRLKTLDVPVAFSRNQLMSDAFFVDVDWLDAPGLRAFFARVPGTGRSWLLGATLAGRDAADLIVGTARAEGLNPAVLVRGCGEGCFCPDRRVTRAERAALLLRAGPDSAVDGRIARCKERRGPVIAKGAVKGGPPPHTNTFFRRNP